MNISSPRLAGKVVEWEGRLVRVRIGQQPDEIERVQTEEDEEVGETACENPLDNVLQHAMRAAHANFH